MKSIIATFIMNPEQNEHRCRNSDRQSRDVDKRIYFSPFETPESDFKIIFEHDEAPFYGFYDQSGQRSHELAPEPAL